MYDFLNYRIIISSIAAYGYRRYMQGFKCQVTGDVGQRQLSEAKPPVWCAGDNSKCRKGAKQMIVFNRKSFTPQQLSRRLE